MHWRTTVRSAWWTGAGSSAGVVRQGLLKGAVYSQRPDRWRAVVAEVPFIDVVTAMSDPSIPLTVNEWDEWGDPREREFLTYMTGYSPYENLPSVGARPPLLVTGALHDPRVLVREPAKWVMALRASDPGWGEGADPGDPTSPGTVLFRVETAEGSHSGPAGRFPGTWITRPKWLPGSLLPCRRSRGLGVTRCIRWGSGSPMGFSASRTPPSRPNPTWRPEPHLAARTPPGDPKPT
ncbi:MAG: prolyl oligopeptidase family serine peptidase [Micrococcales bacterium]|nr:prolyl oligopeptidase family serine peptidase [Micrococcales bacterium]